jgi:hypothetical protein
MEPPSWDRYSANSHSPSIHRRSKKIARYGCVARNKRTYLTQVGAGGVKQKDYALVAAESGLYARCRFVRWCRPVSREIRKWLTIVTQEVKSAIRHNEVCQARELVSDTFVTKKSRDIP